MIIPQIIITGFTEDATLQKEMQSIIRRVEEKFFEMDIKILVPHENFSYDEMTAWINEISNPADFLINIQKKESFQVLFTHQSEEEIASRLVVNTAQRIGITPEPSFLSLFPAEKNDIENMITSFPIHTWNIIFPKEIEEKQLILNIMACVTDMYTNAHSLLPTEKIWPFRDVPSSHFAFEAIKKAKEKRVIVGYKGDIFYPNGGITRGEVLYILDKLGLL